MELFSVVIRIRDMPRTARPPHEPGSVLHVICRGVEQRDVFLSDDDRAVFLSMLRASLRKYDVALLAYVLMGNHFHLLAAVSETRIGVPMHLALTRYSQYFNRKYRRSGHLFQDRFKAKLCRSSSYLVRLVAYIHLNPIRAGMVGTPSAWPWSSHVEFVEGTGQYLELGRLEDVTGMTPDELRARYQEALAPAKFSRSLDEMVLQAAYLAGVDPDGVAHGGRGEGYTKARRILTGWALEEGISLAELSRALNCSLAALSQLRSSTRGRPSA